MGEVTGIEWCDSTANLWRGCTKVSDGCDNCYAAEMFSTEGNRFKNTEWGPKGSRIRVLQGWKDLRKWNAWAEKNGGIDPVLGRRRRVFINSLSDIFDNHSSIGGMQDEFWQLVRECRHLIFILVTKRPSNLSKTVPHFWNDIRSRICILLSVEDQENADIRLRHFYEAMNFITPPLVLGLSYEPALAPINLSEVMIKQVGMAPIVVDALRGRWRTEDMKAWQFSNTERVDRAGANGMKIVPLQWIIMGGESGKNHRPMDGLSVLDTRANAKNASVAFFFKQMAGKKAIPDEFMTREFPLEFGDAA